MNSTIEAAAAHIPEQHRAAFHRFVETGEATEEFLQFLDQDSHAQTAVEQAFSSQFDDFEQMVETLRQYREASKPAEVSERPSTGELTREVESMVTMIKNLGEIPPQRLKGVIREIVHSEAKVTSEEPTRTSLQKTNAILSSVLARTGHPAG
jgi:hypothetical protein